jgi:hypothetical protein
MSAHSLPLVLLASPIHNVIFFTSSKVIFTLNSL